MWRAFADDLIDTKNYQIQGEWKNHILFESKLAKLDASTLFLTKKAKKRYSLEYTHISYRTEKPPSVTKVILESIINLI